MPLYFFDIQDGRTFIDEEGTMLADPAAAHTEAVRLAGGVIRDSADQFSGAHPWRFGVRDEAGIDLFSFIFGATEPLKAA